MWALARLTLRLSGKPSSWHVAPLTLGQVRSSSPMIFMWSLHYHCCRFIITLLGQERYFRGCVCTVVAGAIL